MIGAQSQAGATLFLANNGAGKEVVYAQLGISVELLSALPPISDSLEADTNNISFMKQFVQFAAENLFNYVASFARDDNPATGPLVPLHSIKQWFDTTIGKLSFDPYFWRR